MKHPLTFEEVFKELPDCCGFDPLAHTTVEDLTWLARVELDLHEEGQDGCCTKREAAQLRKFLKAWAPHLLELDRPGHAKGGAA